MKRYGWLILVVCCGCLLGRGVFAAGGQPNIIVIMSDDMGFSDIGCYGSEVATPNIDSLADGGVRFTQFYNSARCCPTRASLLTGLYPHQAGVGHMMDDRGQDGYRGDLAKSCVTFAEVLKPAGYSTYMAGKWHVTRHLPPKGDKHNWPLQRGFDKYYGTLDGAGSFFDPGCLLKGNTQISCFNDPEYQPETYYYTEAISHYACQFIREHQKEQGGKPFFLYVAYTCAHWPMQALPADIAKYKGRYDQGYGKIRQARFDKQKKLGVIDASCKLSKQAQIWANESHKEWNAACMEVYAAMVDSMDQGIGKIIDQLKQSGQLENTLIFFLHDNGACAENPGRTPTKDNPNQARAEAPTLAAIALDVPLNRETLRKQTREGYPIRMGNKVMPGPGDTFIAYGRGWANVSNTPFKEYKHWVHEGGIATPLIVHWPARVKGGGSFVKQPGHLIDIMATVVDVSGARYPQEATPLEGISLLPALTGSKLKERLLYWEHEGNAAVRDGDWKLVRKGREGKWELYNIAKDRSEVNNLAEQNLKKVDELDQKWHEWARRTNVIPYP